MVNAPEKIQDIDKAKIVLQNIETKDSDIDTMSDGSIWISCRIKATPKGYAIWIPKGAFK